jgi:hypothetical protein
MPMQVQFVDDLGRGRRWPVRANRHANSFMEAATIAG